MAVRNTTRLTVKLAVVLFGPFLAFLFIDRSVLDHHIRPRVTNDPAAGLARSLSAVQLALDGERTSLEVRANSIAVNETLKRALRSFPKGSPGFRKLAKALDQSDLFVLTNSNGGVLYDDLGLPAPPAPAVPTPVKSQAKTQVRLPDKKAKPLRADRPVPPSVPLYPAADWPGIERALAGSAVSGLFPYKDRLYLAASCPVVSGGKVVGTVLLGVPWTAEDLSGLKTSAGNDLVLSEGPKTLFSTFPAPRTFETGSSVPSGPGKAVTIASRPYLAGGIDLKDLKGAPVWRVTVYQPVVQAVTVEGDPRRTIEIWGALLLLLIAALGAWLASDLILPLGRTIEAVEKMRSGETELSLPLKRRDGWGDLARSLNDLAESGREKDRVSLVLGKVVSPQAARKILAEKDYFSLKGEVRVCSVLQAELKGFAALSGNMAPPVLVETLNQYFSLIHGIVFKHEGMLDKFIGGSAVAVWGAPFSHPDMEQRAVKAALEIQEVLKEFNVARIRGGAQPLTIGIGVHTGKAVAGNLGSDKRWDYSLIGEAPDTASVLCSLAGPGQTVVTVETFLKVSPLVKASTLSPIEVKGVMVGVYSIVKSS